MKACQHVAEKIAETFSLKYFTELFGDKKLRDGWTYNDALAAWYSLGNLSLIIAVWQTHGKSPERANEYIDCVREELLRQWQTSDALFLKLQTIVTDTEPYAYKSFSACKNSNDLELFFSRYVSLILGFPVPFTEHSEIEDILSGIEYGGGNLILNTTISREFVSTTTAIKNILIT